MTTSLVFEPSVLSGLPGHENEKHTSPLDEVILQTKLSPSFELLEDQPYDSSLRGTAAVLWLDIPPFGSRLCSEVTFVVDIVAI
jgi:hypothetical protein